MGAASGGLLLLLLAAAATDAAAAAAAAPASAPQHQASSPPQQARSAATAPAPPASSALAFRLAADKLWAGSFIVTKGGKPIRLEAYGDAVPELGAPMRTDFIGPIGSNSKLFTAVAIWQLQEQGKLDVNRPFTNYVNWTALGLPPGWCPRLADSTGRPTGPCLVPPTIEQLLRMSGGIIDKSNCEYPPGAWQLRYCAQSQTACSPQFAPPAFFSSVLGAATPADTIRVSGALLLPFDFKPGTGHHYSNEAFILASHIVEHVSGLPLPVYFRRRIFEPLGLASTFLDLASGQDGVYKGTVPYPAYVSILSPPELGLPALDKSYIGSATFTSGTLSAGSGDAAKAAPPLGRWAKTARPMAPSVPGSDFSYASGSGAIQSSPADVARWLRVLTSEPRRLGLAPETVARMLNASTRVPAPNTPTPFGSVSNAVRDSKGRLRYAQGVGVMEAVGGPSGARKLGVDGLYYKGSLGGFDATYWLDIDPVDSSKDVLVYVFTTTDTNFPPYSPYIITRGGAGKGGGGCAFRAPRALLQKLRREAGSPAGEPPAPPAEYEESPLPSYMCEAQKPRLGQGPAALLLETLVREHTGKGVLGLPSPL